MPSAAVQKVKGNLSPYPVLLKRVKETLLLGQEAIEKAKVQTYWQTGKLIHEHILHHQDRAEFGKQVIKKLAADLGTGDDLLYRALKFHQAFPISATSRKLTWSHYVELSKIPDKSTRFQLTARAEKSEWSAKQLAGEIQREISPVTRNGGRPEAEAEERPAELKPKLGELYTYRLIREEGDVQGDDFLRVDLGFEIRKRLSKEEAKGLRANQIIESIRDDSGEYTFRKSERKEDALYTYKARVLRVIDGDTLFCLIDFGFNTEQRHYLRLRSIDAYEMPKSRRIVPGSRDPGVTARSEDLGKKAKAFVIKALEKVPEILMTSSRDYKTPGRSANTDIDKYGRYLADVFIPGKSVILSDAKDLSSFPVISTSQARTATTRQSPSRERAENNGSLLNLQQDGLLFLNQLLLDEGLAVKI